MTPTTPAGQRRRTGQEGFSLVELAIVLIIIGLIVGGVLKGQDLIESARINSIQTQVNEVRVATTTFQTKYDSLPGDMLQADEALIGNGWAAAGVATTGGTRGNGQIEGGRMAAAGQASEATLFWQHLRAAGLLSGVPVTADGSLATAAGGFQSRIGGLYTIAYQSGNLPNGTNPSPGHWIRLGGANTTDNDVAVLTPVQMRSIDVKGDDGLPNTGNIAGLTGNGITASATAGCAANTTSTTVYNALTTIQCYANFKL